MPWKINKLATDVAQKAVGSLEGAGVFAVELFLTEDSQVFSYMLGTLPFLFSFLTYRSFSSSQILLNEVAPRPHNSGHQTIECCCTSQFEQHLRAVVGLPLGDPSMRTPASIMYNILGEDDVIDICLSFIFWSFLIIIPIALSSYPLNEHVVAFGFNFFNFREKLVSNWLIGLLQGLCVFQVHLFIGMTSQVRFLFPFSFLVVCCQFLWTILITHKACTINSYCQKWESRGRWVTSLLLGGLWVFWNKGYNVY